MYTLIFLSFPLLSLTLFLPSLFLSLSLSSFSCHSLRQELDDVAETGELWVSQLLVVDPGPDLEGFVGLVGVVVEQSQGMVAL